MKNILYIFLILGGLAACQDFEEINENPNEPIEVSPDVLLNASIRSSVNTNVDAAFLLGNNAAQLTAKTLRTEVDDYNWNAFPTVWEGFYEPLTDLKGVSDFAQELDDPALEALAIIMRSWIFANLTNAYGNIPYSEAINGLNSEFSPAYDDQEFIYMDLLDELERANNLLAEGDPVIESDLLFNRDFDKWRKFCNSLRLRLLMMASNKMDVASRFSQIVNNEPIMESNADNAVFNYLSTFPNQFLLIPIKTGDFDAVAISSTLVDLLDEYNDPRLYRYARPGNEDFENYFPDSSVTGADNGRNTETCSKIGARLGVPYYNYPDLTTAADLGIDIADGVIMTFSEVQFLLAEAAAKGWISGDVESYYRTGIESSMVYHQVNLDPFGWDSFDDFYTNSGVAYSEVTDIWEQKWVNSYFHGLEPYFDLRRWYIESGNSWDGIPFIDAPCSNVNDDQLPMRFPYPGEEQSLNPSNYQDAVSEIGEDSKNTRTWLTN